MEHVTCHDFIMARIDFLAERSVARLQAAPDTPLEIAVISVTIPHHFFVSNWDGSVPMSLLSDADFRMTWASLIWVSPVNEAESYIRQYIEAMELCTEGVKLFGDPTPVMNSCWSTLRSDGQRASRLQAQDPSRLFSEFLAACSQIAPSHLRRGMGVSRSHSSPSRMVRTHDGRIVDTTWRKLGSGTKYDEITTSEWSYFGVPFDAIMLDFWMRRKQDWSVLFHLRYDQPDYGVGMTTNEILATDHYTRRAS